MLLHRYMDDTGVIAGTGGALSVGARAAAQNLAAVDPCDELVRQPCTAGERKK